MEDLKLLLQEHGLGEHEAVLEGQGYDCVEQLVELNEDQVDDLRDALVENGADKVASRRFLRGLKNKARQVNHACLHFYGLADRINCSDVSGLEESTVVKVDIDPLNQIPDRIHVPLRSLCRLAQSSSPHPVPVVTLLGPTGAGKSLIASSFMQSNDGVLPLVATPDQHVPTLAHVCAYKGAIHSGSRRSRPILLFDFEGEDGRVPKTLLEVGMRKLNLLRMAGLTEDALQKQLEETTARRQEVIRERLPPLAYLLSDVVVFIDTAEPRRTDRCDRIRRFATQAHQAVTSLAWKPALILVQNKWMRETHDAPFNVNHELDWLREGLAGTFSSVTVLRVAHRREQHCFEASLNELHNEILRMVEDVFRFRRDQGVLFSERDFWFNFKAMVAQFGRPGQVCSLEHFVSRNLASTSAADNAICAYERLATDEANDPVKFSKIVRNILLWYAYGLAGEVRRDRLDVQSSEKRLHATYDSVIQAFQRQEPCAAKLHHDGNTYPCTQLCTGHGKVHKNPALISVPSQNFLKRIVFWKDQQPCVWTGNFETVQPLETSVSYAEIEKVFLEFLQQDAQAYLESSTVNQIGKDFGECQRRSSGHSDICWLCLRVDSDQVRLKHDNCRHFLCRTCLLTRRMLLGPENTFVVCPFCHLKSDECFHSSQDDKGDKGFRILSLDGGGVRGLIEVLVLKRLEEVFAPLPIISLFDLIIGTSAGGLIALALLKNIPLARLEDELEAIATDIFSVNFLTRFICLLTGMPMCDGNLFEETLEGLFENEDLQSFRRDMPPYVFCVAYDLLAEEPVIFGNCPKHFDGTAAFSSTQTTLHRAARSTAAAPIIFHSVPCNPSDSSKKIRLGEGTVKQEAPQRQLVDGGVVANCPARLGVKVATELQAASKGFDDTIVESIASVGTGLREPSVALTEMNALSWAGKLIDMATDSEQQWADLENVAELQSKPRVRVNPPNLGSLDAFGSKSIPKVRAGMVEYFDSDLGKQQMGKLIHMTYAKLWEVKQSTSLVAGGEGVKFQIVMTDPRCNFNAMETDKLKNIILQRGQGLEEHHLEGLGKEELCNRTKEAFGRKPFLHHFDGKFVYRFAGIEHELADEQMEFQLVHLRAGTPELDVFWRSVHGDISLCGLPRVVRVSE